MSKLDKIEVLNVFEVVYEVVNGKKFEIIIKFGWYSIDGGKNLCFVDVVVLIEEFIFGKIVEFKVEEVLKVLVKKIKIKIVVLVKIVKKVLFIVVIVNDDGYKVEEFWIVNLVEKDYDCCLLCGVV